jgi:hypothetical protein
MMRLMTAVIFAMLMGTGPAELAFGAELKPIHAQKTKDVIVTLASESGQWRPGKNDFVLELTSAKDKQPIDAGKVTLNTSMTMSGMAPMIAGATLSPDKTPGRYVGTINFADGGTRQVTVTWDGPAGKGSTRFSVSVR